MGILSAENSTSFDTNNACRIYIVKQVELEKDEDFRNNYLSYIESSGMKLTPLLIIPFNEKNPDKNKYFEIPTVKNAKDFPKMNVNEVTGNKTTFIKEFKKIFFYKDLLELSSCPLLDFTKNAYIFQVENKLDGGLSDVVSFEASFNVHGQSSCSININNQDFKYNFKDFINKKNYNTHLKSFFDTNDIVIVRVQNKNNTSNTFLNYFNRTNMDFYEDRYLNSENDPLTTIFTGYINNVNNSFSFSNGMQTIDLQCTGPSKLLTWTRFLSNKAVASKDSESAILPLSAFINPQTINADGTTSISNKDVVRNVIVRTLSGINSSYECKELKKEFTEAFDKNLSIITDTERKRLTEEIEKAKTSSQKQTIRKKLQSYNSTLAQKVFELRDAYNKYISQNMNNYIDVEYDKNKQEVGLTRIKKHCFLQDSPTVFEINGTNQPSYQYTFNNFSTLFQSNFSTVYQFIKSIADSLDFNFYDDPYGTIHFSIIDLTLEHLHSENHSNNLRQLISFSESQDTETIANIQPATAQSIYGLTLDMINTVVKDYSSISKYGEKLMQPFSMPGIQDTESLKYAAKMKMAKYNRKALSSIRVSCQGEPNISLGKYAYIKELRKLFYIESYSHSYNAGDNITTSINGTYTRNILAIQESTLDKSDNVEQSNMVYYQMLKNCESYAKVNDVLEKLEILDKNFQDSIYTLYVAKYGYPKDSAELKYEISQLYKEKNLKECILDGFFWEIPFDADPYKQATIKKIEEKKKSGRLLKIIDNKTKKASLTKKGEPVKVERLTYLPEHETPYIILKCRINSENKNV